MAKTNIDPAVLQNPSATDGEMRTELNKVRASFPSAFVSTFTYNPLVGISSQADINNRITYYDYDALGRLTLIRDHDKNIIRKICYNYQGQEGGCSVKNQVR